MASPAVAPTAAPGSLILFEDPYIHPRYGVPGLRIRKNPRNQFCVVSLYFFADEAKRSDAWEAAARAGMTRAGFEKEYLINYTALFGEKVFPQIYERGSEIIVPSRTFDPARTRFYGGFDYGPRNPTAFLVFAVEKDEEAELGYRTYAVWEHYEPCRNISALAVTMRACPYWRDLQWVAADPSIWSPTQQVRSGNLTSVQQMLADEGIDKLVRGVTDETAWTAAMRMHWSTAGPPTFCILRDTCPNLVRELQMAVYADPKNVEVNRVLDERIADSNNHALDATKYFMNSMPTPGATVQNSIKWPIMVNRWKR